MRELRSRQHGVVLSDGNDLSDLGRACDAALRVLATRGGGALSVRAIATEMDLTGPALTHRWDSRARLWQLLTSEIGDRWLREVGRAVRDRGPEGLLPLTTEEVEDARTWRAMADLGRSDSNLSGRVADNADRERGMLRFELESEVSARLPDPVVDALHAVAVGLRERLCSRDQPMTPARAVEAWRAALAALVPTSRSSPGRRARHAADA